jgi:hypothetical protein
MVRLDDSGDAGVDVAARKAELVKQEKEAREAELKRRKD